MRRRASLAIACMASIVTGACERGGARGSDSAAVSPSAQSPASPRADSASGAPTAAAVTSPTGCVSEGAWQACSLEKRLTDAGFVPVPKDTALTGLFDVAGSAYAIGPAELHVYLFQSSRAREQAVAGIDSVAVVRRGATASWPVPPTLITSNNLVAVLLSDNARLIERVQNAITAGLPSAAQ